MMKRRWSDLFYLIGFSAVGSGIVADIMLSNALEENQQLYILSFLMMVFVFVQATLLIRDWVMRGREREKLSAQLEELNRSLEDRVRGENQGAEVKRVRAQCPQ